MEDLILSGQEELGVSVTKIIEFVKQLERERGLSEEEIQYKYACGHCDNLAKLVVNLINNLFGKQRTIGVDKVEFTRGDGQWTYHSYVKVINPGKGPSDFYDILGKKNYEETQQFIEEMHDGEFELAKKFKGSNFRLTRNFGLFRYVTDTCEQHIKVDTDTRIS